MKIKLFILLLLSVCLCSCSDSDDNNSSALSSIVGTWYEYYRGHVYEDEGGYAFFSNGTGRQYFDEDTDSYLSFKWSVTDGIITMTSGALTTRNRFKIEDNILTIYYNEGGYDQYIRKGSYSNDK